MVVEETSLQKYSYIHAYELVSLLKLLTVFSKDTKALFKSHIYTCNQELKANGVH